MSDSTERPGGGAAAPPETPTETPAQRAYQGEKSGRMRTVLGLSLALAAVIVIGLAFAWHEARRPPAPPTNPAAANALPDSRPNAPQP